MKAYPTSLHIAKLAPLTGFLILAACDVVGPDFVAPELDLSETFVEGSTSAVDNTVERQWWLDFNDARLNALVARGQAQNLDLQSAFERIRSAEAQLAGTGVATQLSGSITGQTQRSEQGNQPTDTSSSLTTNAAYTFDLFGGVRRGQDEAIANLEAAKFDVGTVRLAYLSSIVDNYIAARYFQEALELTRQTIASRERTLEIVRDQRDLGAGTDLGVAQAQAELDTAHASLPAFEIEFHSAVYRIATLLAEPAGPLLADLQLGAAQPVAASDVAVGIPANLLRNRPDIRAAESRYAAAVAAVGVAEADLYPSLTLSGSITAASTNSWTFGPAFSFPVLGRGAIKARRDAAQSSALQAQLDWRSSVLDAVEDVQIAQGTYLRRKREVASLRNVVVSNERVLTLSRSTFASGDTSVLDLLDAERADTNARTSLAASVRNLAASWVSLQIATGSGWSAQGPQNAS